MTEPEFQSWLTYHLSCFPTLETWLAKIKEAESRGGKTTLAKVLGAWSRCLEDVELRAAKQATDKLMRGDEPSPKSPDEYPRIIRRLARSGSQSNSNRAACPGKWRDGEWLYDCPLCEDTGLLTIWSSVSVQAMKDGRFGEYGTRTTAAVRCVCSRGERKRAWDSDQYDADRHCLWGLRGGQDDVARLEEFCGRAPPVTDWSPTISYHAATHQEPR